jgi:hypothetical protein
VVIWLWWASSGKNECIQIQDSPSLSLSTYLLKIADKITGNVQTAKDVWRKETDSTKPVGNLVDWRV